ncbi:MAG: hypothetical protein WC654_00250 [Patescibacteria group bacterium]
MTFNDFSGVLNIVLALIAVFQWLDRRSRNRAIENFVGATIRITKRLKGAKGDLPNQKADDICDNLLAIRETIQGGLIGFKRSKKR